MEHSCMIEHHFRLATYLFADCEDVVFEAFWNAAVDESIFEEILVDDDPSFGWQGEERWLGWPGVRGLRGENLAGVGHGE